MVPSLFVKIDGIRKIIKCKSCGRRIEVKNLNRDLCKYCES